jgi:hypothetical protein
MSATAAALAALRLIKTIAEGGTTPDTALPHIARIADSALGGAAPQDQHAHVEREAHPDAWPEGHGS